MLINKKLTKRLPATIVCPYITLVLVIKKSHMLILVVFKHYEFHKNEILSHNTHDQLGVEPFACEC